jgi:hypothetical protein
MKGHNGQSSAGEGERKQNQAVFGNQVLFLFPGFYTILHFAGFCRMRYFDFFNSVLIKNLEMDYSFF